MANTTFSDLLGSLTQTGLSPATMDRLKGALGAGGPASGTDLPNLLKSLGLDTSKLGDILGGTGKIGDILGGLFGGQKGEGIGQTLSGTLEEAQKAVGENKNLALAALGALAGAILGGGSRSMKGAVGGGVLAVLGALAYQVPPRRSLLSTPPPRLTAVSVYSPHCANRPDNPPPDLSRGSLFRSPANNGQVVASQVR